MKVRFLSWTHNAHMPAQSPANNSMFMCDYSASVGMFQGKCYSGWVTFGENVAWKFIEVQLNVNMWNEHLPSPLAASVHISYSVLFLVFHRSNCEGTQTK